MVTLESLAEREAWCAAQMVELHHVNSFVVMPDERTAEHEPIIAAWKDLHGDCLRMAAARTSDSREALKRALFIQWFEVAEPFFLTGILDIDDQSNATVIELVDEAMQVGDDAELWQMVAWDGQVAEYAFGSTAILVTPPRTFLQALTAGTGLGWLTSDRQRQSCITRGSMGAYFGSLTTTENDAT